MELSQKLKELRKKQGLTQLELAERLFVSRQAISGWEAGTSRPSTENLQSLSRLFINVTTGSIDKTIEIPENGDYTLAIRNNSSKSVKVTGVVRY